MNSPRDVYAALDMGSNSFHLIIARETENGIQVVDRYKESVRLAEGMSTSRSISNSALKRTQSCLQRISQRIRNLPKQNVRIVGTAALRDARNRDRFIDTAEEILGHPIEVISGREEARLIHLAVSYFQESGDSSRLVVDIGGGSTEVIFGRSFRPRIAESLKMGCVLVSDQFFPDGVITRERLENAIQHGEQELEVIEQTLLSQNWQEAIGTSGTIRAVLVAIQSLYPNTTEITIKGLQALQKRLISLGHIQRFTELNVSKNRTPVFAGGVAILSAVFASLKIKNMNLSPDSLREGLLHDLLGRVHDEDIREQSVRTLMSRYDIDVHHAENVSKTAIALFDQVQEVWELGEEGDKQLLNWAALLHEIGMNISHSGYHKHGSYLLNNLDMPGFSLTEQHYVAVLVQAHRRKYPSFIVSSSDRLAKLSILLRIAVLLRRNRSSDTLPTPKITPNSSELVVSMQASWIEEHPLTLLDFEQEVQFLESAPIQLRLEASE